MAIHYMGVWDFDEKVLDDWPWIAELKTDGVRAFFVIKPLERVCKCYSRGGNEFTSVKHLCDEVFETYRNMRGTSGLVLDTELDCGDFNTTVSRVRRKYEQAEKCKARAFDLVSYEAFADGADTDKTWVERREEMEMFVDMMPSGMITPTEMETCYSLDEINEYFERVVLDGGEGLVLKNLHSKWGDLVRGWMRLTQEKSEDLKVIGISEGAGRLEGTLGALVVAFGEIQVHVGTGFSDKVRAEIWKTHHEEDGIMGLTAEVKYKELTIHGSLRHPVFKCFRIDK